MEEKKAKNISKTFILPLILGNTDIHKKGIVNTFLYKEDNPEFNKDVISGIFLLLSYEYVGKADLKFNPNCKYIIDVDKDHFLAFISNDDIKVWFDIEQIMRGKYSQISLNGKKMIKKFYNLPDSSPIIGVLNKSPILRKKMEETLNVNIPEEIELGNKININKETFKHKLVKVNKI